jgi:hypothetical protein
MEKKTSLELAEALKDKMQLTQVNSHGPLQSPRRDDCKHDDEKQETTTTSQSTKWQALEVERQTIGLALNIRADLPVVVLAKSGRRSNHGRQDSKRQKPPIARRG